MRQGGKIPAQFPEKFIEVYHFDPPFRMNKSRPYLNLKARQATVALLKSLGNQAGQTEFIEGDSKRCNAQSEQSMMSK